MITNNWTFPVQFDPTAVLSHMKIKEDNSNIAIFSETKAGVLLSWSPFY